MNLASRWLDLDRIAGTAENSSPLDSIVPLALRLRDLLPADGRSRASFTVDQANIGRESISGLRLALVRSRDKLEVEELRLGMPGGSRGELQGTMSGPVSAPVFDGTLGLRGVSVVRFLGWARGAPLRADTKGDGAFGVRARVSIATGRFELRDIIGDLSGTALYGAAHYRWEGRPEISLAIEGPQIDVRPFVPAGASLYRHVQPAGHTRPPAAGPAQPKPTDAIDPRQHRPTDSGRTRTIATWPWSSTCGAATCACPCCGCPGEEGYSLELEGEVDDVGGRPKGSIRAVAAAETPQGILPLAELLGVRTAFRPGERRAQGIAPLRLGGSIAFGARTPTAADILLDGEANGASVRATARLDGNAAGWRKGFADVTGTIEGPEAGRIVAALLGSGGPSGGDGARPGRILVKAGGLPADGLTTIASDRCRRPGARLSRPGLLKDTGNKFAGDLEIKGADATRIATIAGLAPPLRLDAVPVSGAMKITGGRRQPRDRTAVADHRRQRGERQDRRCPRRRAPPHRRAADGRRAEPRPAAGAGAGSAPGHHRHGRNRAVGPTEPLAGRAVRHGRARGLRRHHQAGDAAPGAGARRWVSAAHRSTSSWRPARST